MNVAIRPRDAGAAPSGPRPLRRGGGLLALTGGLALWRLAQNYGRRTYGSLLVPWWRWCYRSLLLGRWHSLQPPEKHEEAGLFYWNQNRAALHVDPLARRLSVGWVWLRYAWLVAGAPFASLCCDWSAGSVPTVDSSFFLLHGMKMSTNCPESTRDTSLERGLRRQRD